MERVALKHATVDVELVSARYLVAEAGEQTRHSKVDE